MEGPGSPDSTALSVVREIPTRLAISTVPMPSALRRRLSLSPSCKSSWHSRMADLSKAFICPKC